MLGLTNYSSWPGTAVLRECLAFSKGARKLLLDVALQRLDRFVHVGVFDRLEESVTSLAATLNMDLDGSSWQVIYCYM